MGTLELALAFILGMFTTLVIWFINDKGKYSPYKRGYRTGFEVGYEIGKIDAKNEGGDSSCTT